ncbi:DUF6924 domain-containing protein [Nocardiopsis trehalosi]|uniref:DUF6924 domain-containing protein n=1 Tax=Nocardiopsis trehalosi TaxID=109329 RepID=UPI000A0260D6|nr:hypothetical protein [Nocardiopsis trehalosi]
MRPALPLPPADADGDDRVPGMLLVRADHDDDAWRDVLHRMGDLPGLVAPPPDGAPASAPVPEEGAVPRLLVVVDDPAWRGATPEEVGAALGADGTWVPDLVLLATDRTAADPELRPLRAFRTAGEGDAEVFRITPLQAALTYLLLHHDLDYVFDDFAEWGSVHSEWEPEEDDGPDDIEAGLPDPVGAHLERLDPRPRYTPPARALPLLTLEEDVYPIVRTDFGDDAAWAALLDAVYRPGDPGPIEDYADYFDAVDDPAFASATPEQVLAVLNEADDVVLLADAEAMRDPAHRVLVVCLDGRIGTAFRLDPRQVGLMVVNLSIGNQDVEDYMDDGTLRAIGLISW